MKTEFISLFVILLVSTIAPIVAKLIPKRMLPETVLLLLAGAVLGPHMLGFIQVGDAINMLSELGMAFLFLLAGYEIDPKILSGEQGKRGFKTWLVTAVLAGCVMLYIGYLYYWNINRIEMLTLAITFTTTAIGTLIPILKERKLNDTPVGNAVLSYGTWGELCPVIAMALLLSSRAEWKTVVILLAFAAICVIAAVVPVHAKKAGHAIYRLVATSRNTSQNMVRLTILLLIGLVTLSEVFDLDVVLGSFAAGFVLRYIIPEGDESLELRIDAISYGFFIPIFFVVSGTKINLYAIGAQPKLLAEFIAILLLVRAIPVLISLSREKDRLSIHHRISVALYCTTALPVIVAVTTLAVNSGSMEQETAGILIAAGAITVLLMPLLASGAYALADVHPIVALKEIVKKPQDTRSIIEEHVELERMLHAQEKQDKIEAHKLGFIKGEPSWQTIAYSLQKKSEKREELLNRLDEVKQEIAKQDESTEHAIARRAIKEHKRRQKEVGRENLHAPQSK